MSEPPDRPETTERRGAPRARRRFLRFGRNEDVELKLDLRTVRLRLGDKWERVAPSVRRFACLVIERHLDSRSSFRPDGEDAFMIRFVATHPNSAARQLRTINAELRELLFGSGLGGEAAEILRRPARAGARRARRGVFARLLDNVRRILRPRRHSRSAASPDSAPVAETASAPTVVDAGPPAEGGDAIVMAHAGGVTATATSLPDLPPSSASSNSPADSAWWSTNTTPNPARAAQPRSSAAGAAPVRAGAGASAGAGALAAGDDAVFVDDTPAVQIAASSRSAGRVRRAGTDALERALYLAIQEAERRNALAMQARLFPPIGTRFIYRPMWLVERGVILLHTCTPACALSPFEFVTGEALLGKGVGPRKIAMLDEMLLDHVVRELEPRAALQMRTTICVPVHFETLTGERAPIYFRELGKLPLAVRRHMAVEIIGITQGVGQLSTYSLVRKLKGYVRTVAGRLDMGDLNFRVWRQTDLSCVGIDVESDGRAEVEQMHDLNNFVVPARQYGLRTYVRGLRTLSLTAAAVASGVDLLDGPAISEGDLVLPEGTRSFGIMDVYTAA